jgi:predicted MPP superfamily phosphohydrolase
MEKGKAFFLVGHRNWGKSRTLRALTNGSRRWYIVVKAVRFFIRRRSNDDVRDDFIRFLNTLDPKQKPYVIVALCPKFDERSTNSKKRNTEKMLRQLREKYNLFFFVLIHQWHENGNGRISDGEIQMLRRLGHVELYRANNRRDDADITRAKKFRKYIERKL